MELGKKLKYFRESKKMSVYRLALEADISQGHLSDLENGKNQPTIILCFTVPYPDTV